MVQYKPRVPGALSLVPYRKGYVSFFNAVSPLKIGRPELYITAAVLKSIANFRQMPATIAQMALADAGYEGFSSLFRVMGKDLEKSPSFVKSMVLNGSRIGGYVVSQELARRVSPRVAEPVYKYAKNLNFMVREAGEDVAADVLWETTKATANSTGITGLLKRLSGKVASKLGLNDPILSELSKDLTPMLVGYAGKEIIKRSVVRPASDHFFGQKNKPCPAEFSFGISYGTDGFKPVCGFSI